VTEEVILSAINGEYINTISEANNEPSWLRQMRNDALSKYQALPSEVSPLYSKYSDVSRLDPDCVRLADQTTSFEPYPELRDRLKEPDQGASVVRIGSSINKILIPQKIQQSGIIMSNLKEALIQHEEVIRNRLTSNRLEYGEDKFLALEASAFQSGLLIYIPKNVVIEEPLKIINSLADDGSSSITRTIIVAEVGSKATIVEEIYAPGVAPTRLNGHTLN